ncbi:MAG: DUF3263 domain-containing protein [Bifidobacteriaceae bacterium]|jgi:hypothetical protein|nr:DUF3263 domain-containing protein [Bifidobacteriaceae bacterium]
MGQARPVTPDPAGSPGLSELGVRVLMFERQWWRYEGSKDNAIRDLFEMDPIRYYQVLNCLIDAPEALAFDPRLVARLRRRRDERRRARAVRRLEGPASGAPAAKL